MRMSDGWSFMGWMVVIHGMDGGRSRDWWSFMGWMVVVHGMGGFSCGWRFFYRIGTTDGFFRLSGVLPKEIIGYDH
jgi:hypothetical protein